MTQYRKRAVKLFLTYWHSAKYSTLRLLRNWQLNFTNAIFSYIYSHFTLSYEPKNHPQHESFHHPLDSFHRICSGESKSNRMIPYFLQKKLFTLCAKPRVLTRRNHSLSLHPENPCYNLRPK